MPKTSETHESPASQAPQASGSARADAVPTLWTERLLLEPVTLELVEAVMRGDRAATETAARAQLPLAWPGPSLVERAFAAALERIRADPATRLWGDRLLILRDPAMAPPGAFPDRAPPVAYAAHPEASPDGGPAGPTLRRVIGSVVFHGRPRSPEAADTLALHDPHTDDDLPGVAEVGYGVEPCSQGLGLATEGTRACVLWALEQPGVRAVRATTFGWHRASLRVIEKLGMVPVGTREHDLLGEMLVFELAREKVVK